MVRAFAHSYPRPPELTSRYQIKALLGERCIFDGVAQPHNPRAVSCRASYLRARLTIQRYGPTFKDIRVQLASCTAFPVSVDRTWFGVAEAVVGQRPTGSLVTRPAMLQHAC